MTHAPAERRVTFRDVLANREFRALYAAQALSVAGDQLARLAVAILVFNRSHSPLLTAVSFGVSYLPWLVGGPLLGGLADRLPRRSVMIACDLVRMVVVLGIAIPGMPTAGLFLLVVVVALMEPPFTAARAALIPDVVGEGEPYAVASTLSNTTNNFGVAVGFAVGGAIAAAIGGRAAILLDATTFALSAFVLLHRVRPRPAADSGPRHVGSDFVEGARIVFGDAYLRWLVLASWLTVGVAITTESVAVPYAAAHHGGPVTAGLLTAALPLGLVLGALFLGRVVRPERAPSYLLPLALATPAVIALTGLDPSNLVVGVIWFVGGACSAMQVIANRVFMISVTREKRGIAFGIAAAGIAVAQGICAIVAGAIAQHLGAAIGIADVALPAFAAVCVISVRTFSSSDPTSWSRHDEKPGLDEEHMPTEAPESRSRPEPRVWLLIAALATVAALCMPMFAGWPPVVESHIPAWWILLLFAIALGAPLHFVFRRQPRSIHLEAVPIVLGLFFLSPLTFLAVRALATAFAYGVLRRQPLIRLAYNVAATSAITLLDITVFRLLVSPGSGVHVGGWPGAFAAVCVDEIASGAMVVVVVFLSDREWTWRPHVPVTALAVGVAIINTFLALCTAAALSYDVVTAWAITVFVVLSVTAVRTYKRLADRHAALDRLYTIARELGPMAAEPGDLAPALTQLRRIIHAETLELAMLADDPDFATVITVSDARGGDGIAVSERELDAESREMLTSPTSRLRAAGPMRRLFPAARGRRDDDQMAVALGSGDRAIALLTAANRSGNVGTFDQSDYRLLEAAAGQLTAALEKGRLVESLRRAATRDSLTNLANLDSLRSFLSTMLDGSTGGVILLLDVDRFHEINDTLGHEAGDMVLTQVAQRLEESLSHGALAARVGGDQFALAIPGHAGGEVARLAALAVKSRIDGPLRLEAISADVRVTIGMARAPEHGTDAPTLLRRAEMAMAAAKGTSSGIAEWEAGFERDGSRRLQLLAGLRQALASNELRVEYQPKIQVGTGEVTGFEALVRWRHPELGAVSPAEFVPLAETSGLIGALTSNMLRMALTACARWHAMGRPVGVAVNISARSLDDPVLVGQVAAMLTASGMEPRWLTLEITESSVMENAAKSLDVLLQLRSLGVRLSIDDFGTGYSSLHQLRGLPVHEVKIDKAFVDHVDGDGADRAVVRAVVELCDSLGLTTVAEGVEQASQAYALDSLGVHQVQGYFYGRPMAEDDATDWLLPRTTAIHAAE